MTKNKISDTVKPAFSPPWRPITAIFVVILIYLGSSIIGELIVSAYPLLKRYDQAQANAWISNTLTQFAYVVIVEALTVWLLYLFIHRYKVTLKSLGLKMPRLRDAGIALIAIPVYVVGYAVLLSIATHLFPSINVNQEQQLGFNTSQGGIYLALTFVSLVILPPLVEEILVRGFLFTSLLKRFKVWIAVILTSAIFAAAHLQFGSGAPLLWVAAIDTFMLSLVLCYLRYKTGSLWPGIFLHSMKNLIAFVSLFVLHLS